MNINKLQSNATVLGIHASTSEGLDSSLTELAAPTKSQGPSAVMAAAVSAAIQPLNEALFMLENLETEREVWEHTELAASHKRLYQMLTKCYAFYMRMKTDSSADVREQTRKGLETFIATRQYNFLSSTHDMNKVVKAVFGGVDRRRVSAYSLALRAALVAGPFNGKNKPTALTESQLSTWLEAQGGVEEIRLGSKNKGMTAKERATSVKDMVSHTKLMSFVADGSAIQFDTNDVDKMVVLIATYRPNGEFELNAVVKNDSVVSAALAAYYTGNKKQLADADMTAATQTKEAQKQSAIELAASEI